MSITATQRVRLGAFVTVSAVVLVVFMAIPIGFKLTDRQKKYYSYFEGESLSGLEQGAVVKFHGVPVGKVRRISYDPKDLLRVKVEMEIQADFPVKEGMFSQTGMMGITGLKYVEIMGGSNSAPLLKAGSEIPAKASTMSMITGKAEAIVAKIEILLNHLNAITAPESLYAVKSIVNNVEAITGDARGFMAAMRPNMESSAKSINDVLARVDSISHDVKLITAQVSSAMSDGRLTTILASVDSSAQSIKKLSDDLSRMVGQGREDITVSLQNLREALENANELTKVLAENPSLLLRGEQTKERDLP